MSQPYPPESGQPPMNPASPVTGQPPMIPANPGAGQPPMSPAPPTWGQPTVNPAAGQPFGDPAYAPPVRQGAPGNGGFGFQPAPPASRNRALLFVLVGAGLALILAVVGGVFGGRALGAASATRADAARVDAVISKFDGVRDYKLYDLNRDDDDNGEGVLRKALRETGVSPDLIESYYEYGSEANIYVSLDSAQMSQSECRNVAGSLLYLMVVRGHPLASVEIESSDARVSCSTRAPLDVTSIK